MGLQWCHQSQLPCVGQTPSGQGSLHALKHQPDNSIPTKKKKTLISTLNWSNNDDQELDVEKTN